MARARTAEVAKAPSSAVIDYGEYKGAGFEDVTQSDLKVAFIVALQANSPQVAAKTVPGAEAGMLYNTVTSDLVPGPDGIVIIPCRRQKTFVEWVPKDEGGGLCGLHEPDSDVVKQAIADNGGEAFGKLKVKTENGEEHDLVETHYFHCLILNRGGTEVEGHAVLPFKSKGLKPSKAWTTAMYGLKGKPPLFANRCVVRTFWDTSSVKGSFYNVEVGPFGDTWIQGLLNPGVPEERALMNQAVQYIEMIDAGRAQPEYDKEPAAGGDGSSEEPPF